MREPEGIKHIINAIDKLSKEHDRHIALYDPVGVSCHILEAEKGKFRASALQCSKNSHSWLSEKQLVLKFTLSSNSFVDLNIIMFSQESQD